MRNALFFGVVSLVAAVASAQDAVRTGSESVPPVCGRGLLAGQTPGGSLGGLELVGLTDDQDLVCFSEFLPLLSVTIGSVSGLDDDTRLLGIDYRPATGALYGLGDQGGVYTIDPGTAEAALQTRLNVKLAGTSFGVDFNPTVDLLRIVSDAGQNLAANVVTGATTVNTALSTPPTAGTTLGVTAAAYTNNDLDPTTATTLFDINTATDRVVIQAPPGNGTLSPTGSLRVDAGTEAGFDIYSQLRNGIASEVKAFASLFVGRRARLYTLNLLTGEASLRGTFHSSEQVVDLAVPLNQN
ncbi:MAG: DUF4394 domain-containing protein [Vicinamibacteria bacterium]